MLVDFRKTGVTLPALFTCYYIISIIAGMEDYIHQPKPYNVALVANIYTVDIEGLPGFIF